MKNIDRVTWKKNGIGFKVLYWIRYKNKTKQTKQNKTKHKNKNKTIDAKHVQCPFNSAINWPRN